MTEQKEIRIPFEDLVNIVIACNCGAELCLDFTKDEVRTTEWDKRAQFKCPVCTKEFDSNLRLGFNDFLAWRNRVLQSKQQVFFRLRNVN